VLLFHHLAHDVGHPFGAQSIGVARFHGLEDPSAIHEKMSDDVRVPNAGVLGLNVKDAAFVPDVVVVAE
jgi:hypothetical protein